MTGPETWRIAPAPYERVARLSAELGVGEVLAQVLVRRGLDDPAAARAFLHPDFKVHSPYLLGGVTAARARIDRALRRGEAVAVHGDYDADGITATFLLVRVLEELGADVRWRLPNRFTEGYGVSVAAIEELAEAGVTLLLTADCGINARDEVARAASLGMDVIVTDHHELEGEPPDCIVITPKLGDYPCRHLAGVGVAFKLAHALLEDEGDPLVDLPLALRPYTDLVAVGTIADVVPLIEENRVLTAIGLGRLRSLPRPGLAALLEVAGGRRDGVDAGVVAFRLGPRLNAAGRLEDASLAMELLGSADREEALPVALRLNELNQERRAIEQAMLASASDMVPDPLPAALVLASPDWHEGVVGIVASRVAERFHRPAILLSVGGEEAKGSGRSIAAFDLLGAVERCAAHLLSFGGHRAACGVRLRPDAIPAFRDAFTAVAAAALDEDDLRRVRAVDAVVGGDELTLGLADELELLAPHGYANRGVTLLLHGAEVVAPRPTRDGRHARYHVRSDGVSSRAIHFNAPPLETLKATTRHDVALTLSKDEYNGVVAAQVEVRGLQALEPPEADLCPTSCDLSCHDRLSGSALWEEVLAEAPAGWRTDDGAAGALRAARSAGRLVDRRGRPVAATLAMLAATGERVLVLVADVAARRPLVSRDVLCSGLDVRGAYVQPACSARAGPRLDEASVVMAAHDVVVARPRLAARFAHVVVLDPLPAVWMWNTVAAAAPEAWFHALWGRPEAEAMRRYMDLRPPLEHSMRTVWKKLDAGSGRFDDALGEALLGCDDGLESPVVLAAALGALGEAGLLVADASGGYHLERPEVKVDVKLTDTYREWDSRYQTRDFLRGCLTAQL